MFLFWMLFSQQIRIRQHRHSINIRWNRLWVSFESREKRNLKITRRWVQKLEWIWENQGWRISHHDWILVPNIFCLLEKRKNNCFEMVIFYSTNCQDHQGTTRHDEKKYEYIAMNLKKELLRHYPVIKVYMKPLITEEQDRSISN